MRNIHKFFVFSLLVFSLAFATAPITCETDLDCQELNEGNVCMGGTCGFAQEPADETADNCYTDDFCFNEGFESCGANGTCIPYPPLEDVMEEVSNCYTDAFCIENGYDLCTFPNEEPGSCEYENPYGEYACETDEYCQQNNLGSECTNGVCAYVQPPVDNSCLPILFILPVIAFSLFAFRKK